MTAGLYPPVGTPRGTRFYAHNQCSGVDFVFMWHPPRMPEGTPLWDSGTGFEVHPMSEFAASFTLGPRIPDPEHLLHHDQETNRRLAEANQRAGYIEGLTTFLLTQIEALPPMSLPEEIRAVKATAERVREALSHG